MEQGPSQFPKPGAALWAVDTELETDVFRSGAASKPNVEYLRWLDLGIARSGRIDDEDSEKFEVEPGKGISLFLERMAPEGMVLMDATQIQDVAKKQRKKVHWWSIEQNQPIPAGLELIYDGQPPGHCTLTVTRKMTVKNFLSLVAGITFTLSSVEMFGPGGGGDE